MAYRQIHTKIWKDAWFLDLAPDGKLLFFYLCTNERTNILGLYDLPLKVIAFETDLDTDTIRRLLAEFEHAGKVYYENGWVWVKNLMRYNAQNAESPKVKQHIQATIAELPAGRLKTLCLQHNGLPIPCADRAETVPPPDPQEPSDRESNQAGQDRKSGADAPSPSTCRGWIDLVNAQKPKGAVATLRVMFEQLFPGRDPPDYGFIGSTARTVGGHGRLAELFWQVSAKPPSGDVLRYILGIHRNRGNGNSGESFGQAMERILQEEQSGVT